MKNSDTIKSVGFTFLISALAFLAMYFVEIEKKPLPEESISEPKNDNVVKDSLAKLEDSISAPEIYVPENSVEDSAQKETNVLPVVVPVPDKKESVTKEEKPKKEEKVSEKTKEKPKEKTNTDTKKETDKKQVDAKKSKDKTKEKTTEKEDKAKNFVTVSYVIDKDGKFTTAQRIDGLRDRASINKAIGYVKKNIKGKKGKETKGTYVYKL